MKFMGEKSQENLPLKVYWSFCHLNNLHLSGESFERSLEQRNSVIDLFAFPSDNFNSEAFFVSISGELLNLKSFSERFRVSDSRLIL